MLKWRITMRSQKPIWMQAYIVVLPAALALHYLALKTLEMAKYALSRQRLEYNGADSLAVTACLLIIAGARWWYSKMSQRSWHTAKTAKFVVGVLMLQWLALCLHHPVEALFRGEPAHIVHEELLLAVVALSFLTLAYRHFWDSDAELAVIGQTEAPGAEGLILFLSYFSPGNGQNFSHIVDAMKEPQETPEWKTTADKLRRVKDDGSDPESWDWFKGQNWQMPVAAIRHHVQKGKLRKVRLICSAGSPQNSGSAAQFDIFSQIVANLIGPGVSVEKLDGNGIDFEDCAAISKAIQIARDRFRKEGIDYLIDVTGGQKTTTAIGAALTLEMGEQFQYVSTHSYEVKAYDVLYHPREQVIE